MAQKFGIDVDVSGIVSNLKKTEEAFDKVNIKGNELIKVMNSLSGVLSKKNNFSVNLNGNFKNLNEMVNSAKGQIAQHNQSELGDLSNVIRQYQQIINKLPKNFSNVRGQTEGAFNKLNDFYQSVGGVANGKKAAPTKKDRELSSSLAALQSQDGSKMIEKALMDSVKELDKAITIYISNKRLSFDHTARFIEKMNRLPSFGPEKKHGDYYTSTVKGRDLLLQAAKENKETNVNGYIKTYNQFLENLDETYKNELAFKHPTVKPETSYFKKAHMEKFSASINELASKNYYANVYNPNIASMLASSRGANVQAFNSFKNVAVANPNNLPAVIKNEPAISKLRESFSAKGRSSTGTLVDEMSGLQEVVDASYRDIISDVKAKKELLKQNKKNKKKKEDEYPDWIYQREAEEYIDEQEMYEEERGGGPLSHAEVREMMKQKGMARAKEIKEVRGRLGDFDTGLNKLSEDQLKDYRNKRVDKDSVIKSINDFFDSNLKQWTEDIQNLKHLSETEAKQQAEKLKINWLASIQHMMELTNPYQETVREAEKAQATNQQAKKPLVPFAYAPFNNTYDHAYEKGRFQDYLKTNMTSGALSASEANKLVEDFVKRSPGSKIYTTEGGFKGKEEQDLKELRKYVEEIEKSVTGKGGKGEGSGKGGGRKGPRKFTANGVSAYEDMVERGDFLGQVLREKLQAPGYSDMSWSARQNAMMNLRNESLRNANLAMRTLGSHGGVPGMATGFGGTLRDMLMSSMGGGYFSMRDIPRAFRAATMSGVQSSAQDRIFNKFADQSTTLFETDTFFNNKDFETALKGTEQFKDFAAKVREKLGAAGEDLTDAKIFDKLRSKELSRKDLNDMFSAEERSRITSQLMGDKKNRKNILYSLRNNREDRAITMGGLSGNERAMSAFSKAGLGLGLGLSVAGAGLALLTKEVVKFGKESVKAYEGVQALQTQLGVVFSSQGQADQTFSQIEAFAKKSPFGVEQMTQQAILLKQSGVYSSDLMDTMKRIGDLSSGNAEKMKSISDVYARVLSSTTVTARDMRQLSNAGIASYAALSKVTGIDRSMIRSKLQAGKVTSQDFTKMLESLTDEGGTFYGATEKGARTLKARKQNLSDMKQMAKSEIGKWIATFGGYTTQDSYYGKMLSLVEGIWEWAEDDKKRKNNEKSSKSDKAYQKEYDKLLKKRDVLINKGYTEKSVPVQEINKQIAEVEAKIQSVVPTATSARAEIWKEVSREFEGKEDFARFLATKGLKRRHWYDDTLENDKYIVQAQRNGSFLTGIENIINKETGEEFYRKYVGDSKTGFYQYSKNQDFSGEVFNASGDSVKHAKQFMDFNLDFLFFPLAEQVKAGYKLLDSAVQYVDKSIDDVEYEQSRLTEMTGAQNRMSKARQDYNQNSSVAQMAIRDANAARDENLKKRIMYYDSKTYDRESGSYNLGKLNLSEFNEASKMIFSDVESIALSYENILDPLKHNTLSQQGLESLSQVKDNLAEVMDSLVLSGGEELVGSEGMEKFDKLFSSLESIKLGASESEVERVMELFNSVGNFVNGFAQKNGKVGEALKENYQTIFQSKNIDTSGAKYINKRKQATLWQQILASATGVSADRVANSGGAAQIMGAYTTNFAQRNMFASLGKTMMQQGASLKSLSNVLAKNFKGRDAYGHGTYDYVSATEELSRMASERNIETQNALIAAYQQQIDALDELTVGSIATRDTWDNLGSLAAQLGTGFELAAEELSDGTYRFTETTIRMANEMREALAGKKLREEIANNARKIIDNYEKSTLESRIYTSVLDNSYRNLRMGVPGFEQYNAEQKKVIADLYKTDYDSVIKAGGNVTLNLLKEQLGGNKDLAELLGYNYTGAEVIHRSKDRTDEEKKALLRKKLLEENGRETLAALKNLWHTRLSSIEGGARYATDEDVVDALFDYKKNAGTFKGVSSVDSMITKILNGLDYSTAKWTERKNEEITDEQGNKKTEETLANELDALFKKISTGVASDEDFVKFQAIVEKQFPELQSQIKASIKALNDNTTALNKQKIAEENSRLTERLWNVLAMTGYSGQREYEKQNNKAFEDLDENSPLRNVYFKNNTGDQKLLELLGLPTDLDFDIVQKRLVDFVSNKQLRQQYNAMLEEQKKNIMGTKSADYINIGARGLSVRSEYADKNGLVKIEESYDEATKKELEELNKNLEILNGTYQQAMAQDMYTAQIAGVAVSNGASKLFDNMASYEYLPVQKTPQIGSTPAEYLSEEDKRQHFGKGLRYDENINQLIGAYNRKNGTKYSLYGKDNKNSFEYKLNEIKELEDDPEKQAQKWLELSDILENMGVNTEAFAEEWMNLGLVVQGVNATFKEMDTVIRDAVKTWTEGALLNTTKQFGQDMYDVWVNAKDITEATDGIKRSIAGVSAELLDTISKEMVTAGLNLITLGAKKDNFGLIMGGIGLATAGGVGSFLSGVLSGYAGDKDSKNDDDAARAEKLRDNLAELLKQARDDAKYYEETLRAKKAIATNENTATFTKVNDMILTPHGNFSTAPDDYLIATKTPGALGGGAAKVNFQIVNQSGTPLNVTSSSQTRGSDGGLNIKVLVNSIVQQSMAKGEYNDTFTALQYANQGHVVTA